VPGIVPARLASLSLDLDNEWAYLKTRGDPAWESYPSYLKLVVPRILDVLAKRGVRITVFVVGQDAALVGNRDALASISAAGHEIGNHSMRHEPWLHLYSLEELESEFAESERCIEAATGQHPTGFRGPGFSLSRAVLQLLARRGYRYDASTLPSFLGPIARAYYLATARPEPEQRKRVARLFGTWADGLRPLRPYRWDIDEARLLEIPVTTFPGIRAPIHLSYVMYLAGIAPLLARSYFDAALRACRLRGVEPSILLHPLDFLGGEDVSSLRFFPTMGMGAADKIRVVEWCLERMQRSFTVVSVGEHAAAAAARADLPLVKLDSN
jgi:peptidoglycan/xylan/chitin deacetylase (PgdA/CDA1 family)